MNEFPMSSRVALASALLAVSACGAPPTDGSSFETQDRALCATKNVAVYASKGALLHHYALDLSTGTLAAGPSVTLPVPVQYAAPDRKNRHLYVSATGGTTHRLFAFDIDPVSGALTQNGPELVPTGGRIINLSVNHRGSHLVLAHSGSDKAAIVEIGVDGALAGEVAQASSTATGPFPHQARFDRAGRNVIVPGLALNGGDGTLAVFRFDQGQLTKTQTITFPPGLGARHLEYAHTGRFVYVVMERGNRLYTYRYRRGLLSQTPPFDQTTLANEGHNAIARQRAGAIHVHPNGRFLYLSNRQDSLAGDGSLPGENNIAVFALNTATGEPTLVQHIDTRGIEARTFTIDPTGQYLVVGNQVSRTVSGVVVPRSLAVFRIGDDGGLTFLHKYDSTTDGDVFWVGSIELSSADR